MGCINGCVIMNLIYASVSQLCETQLQHAVEDGGRTENIISLKFCLFLGYNIIIQFKSCFGVFVCTSHWPPKTFFFREHGGMLQE